MKRVLSFVLVLMMLGTLGALSGCKKNEGPMKMGLGVAASYGTSTNAEGETNGKTPVTVTAAAVVLNGKGKIVSAALDELDADLAYTAAGKAVAADELKSKMELGSKYGMASYGTDLNKDGVVKEWNEQVKVFLDAVKGKTVEEVKALISGGYADTEIQTAGCTIAVAPFVAALEKAAANAAETEVDKDANLKIGIVAAQSTNDFSEEKVGSAEVETTVTVAAMKEGKVAAALTDCVAATVEFDAKGVVTNDVKAELKTKKEQGKNYGLAAYGADLNKDNVVKEWYEQAAVFDAALVGKTSAEIAALVSKGYGVESLQTAGCTIAVSDMVQAAVKAATV